MMSANARCVLKRLARPLLLLVVFVCAMAGTNYMISAHHLHQPPQSQQHQHQQKQEPTNTQIPLQYGSATIITTIEGDWDAKKEDQVRLLAGSLHRYRPSNGKSPKVVVFAERVPAAGFVEETEAWEGVAVRLVATALGAPLAFGGGVAADKQQQAIAVRRALIRRVMMEHHSNSNSSVVAWVKAGLIYDPLPAAVKEAVGKPNTIGNPPSVIRPVYKRARNFVKNLARRAIDDGVVEGWSESGREVWVEAYGSLTTLESRIHAQHYPNAVQATTTQVQRHKARDFGFQPKPPYTDAACYVDIRTDLVDNAVLLAEVDGTAHQASDKQYQLVIGLPLTSKGADLQEDPVLLKALVPSILRTVSETEWDKFAISLYIAFDHADPLWDDPQRRHQIRSKINSLTHNRLHAVKMYRMARAKRVAMLWSMLYSKAIHDGADYFFQVNDDLTLDTAGWLTHYTARLQGNNDFGVAGPYDPHNGINCAVLTQAMVGKLHHRIFKSLYPVEMRDWKTDRWLTHVYNDDNTVGGYGNNTWCSQDFVARNGAAKTRYKHCEFLGWQVYVEEGRDRIRRFLRDM